MLSWWDFEKDAEMETGYILLIPCITINHSDDDVPLSDFASPKPEDQSGTVVSEGNDSQNFDWTSTFIMGTL